MPLNQRSAICTQFGWDYADLEEYQPGRRVHRSVRLYQTGSGYVIALKEGHPIPAQFDAYAPWKASGPWKGWVVYTSDDADRQPEAIQ